MKLPDKDREQLLSLETSLHKKEVRNSPEIVSRLLAEEFIEFGSSGRIWNKLSIIESLQKEDSEVKVSVEDFTARELAAGVVLVTYVARSSESAAFATQSLRSSIWKLIDGRWQMVFHQGTRAPLAP